MIEFGLFKIRPKWAISIQVNTSPYHKTFFNIIDRKLF